MPSYSRFIELAGRAQIYLFILIENLKQPSAGIVFLDSTALKVCHNKRIYSHKMLKDIAGRGKLSVDWFYGLKLHVLCDHVGRLVSYNFYGLDFNQTGYKHNADHSPLNGQNPDPQ